MTAVGAAATEPAAEAAGARQDSNGDGVGGSSGGSSGSGGGGDGNGGGGCSDKALAAFDALVLQVTAKKSCTLQDAAVLVQRALLHPQQRQQPRTTSADVDALEAANAAVITRAVRAPAGHPGGRGGMLDVLLLPPLNASLLLEPASHGEGAVSPLDLSSSSSSSSSSVSTAERTAAPPKHETLLERLQIREVVHGFDAFLQLCARVPPRQRPAAVPAVSVSSCSASSSSAAASSSSSSSPTPSPVPSSSSSPPPPLLPPLLPLPAPPEASADLSDVLAALRELRAGGGGVVGGGAGGRGGDYSSGGSGSGGGGGLVSSASPSTTPGSPERSIAMPLWYWVYAGTAVGDGTLRQFSAEDSCFLELARRNLQANHPEVGTYSLRALRMVAKLSNRHEVDNSTSSAVLP
jgi:hypothetical protein